jgi:hypothetical protein
MHTVNHSEQKGKRGNDLAILGKRLENDRIQLAFDLGWVIEIAEYNGSPYYEMKPPLHFECADWPCSLKKDIVDGKMIRFPRWHYDDNVLTTGTY